MIWHTNDRHIGVVVNLWKPHHVAAARNKMLEGCEGVQSLQKAVRQFLKKLNIKLSYIQPASPLPGEVRTGMRTQTHVLMFTAPLLTTDQHWEEPARPWTGERQTQCDTSVHWIPLSNKWGRTTDTQRDIMNLKNMMLSGRSESLATTHYTIPSYEMSRKGKSMETKGRLGVFWGAGVGTEANCKWEWGLMGGWICSKLIYSNGCTTW